MNLATKLLAAAILSLSLILTGHSALAKSKTSGKRKPASDMSLTLKPKKAPAKKAKMKQARSMKKAKAAKLTQSKKKNIKKIAKKQGSKHLKKQGKRGGSKKRIVAKYKNPSSAKKN